MAVTSIAAPDSLKDVSKLPDYAGAAMTVDQFLDLPDDGIRSDLIDGRVVVYYEGAQTMTTRGQIHSILEARVAHLLHQWVDHQSPPRGLVFSGEVAARMAGRANALGLDVAYLSPDRLQQNDLTQRSINVSPTLVAAILSPSDRLQDVDRRLQLMLNSGVDLVWIITPAQKTITAHRQSQSPQLFTMQDTLTAEPQLPGFKAPVSDIFSF